MYGATRTNPEIAAAILAGGQARRFGGQDKSRLVVGGRTIIVRQLEVLQHVTSDIFVVGPRDGRFDDLDVPVYPDIVAGCGALGGLHTALETATARRVIVVACDLPFLDVAVLSRLCELAEGHDAAWIRGPRGPEPFIACYQRDVRTVVADRLSRRLLKVADLAEVIRVAWLEGAELRALGGGERVLANLNTPDDYARVQ